MTETARLVIAVDSTQAKQADAALANLGKTSSAVEKNVGALTGALTRVAAPLAAFISTRAVIDAADQYGQMASRMKMATSSAVEYAVVQERLIETANRTYRPLAEAQELYIRTADSLKNLGYETSSALDITDSFSYLLVTNAASADRANSAISAYSKAIQTGRVDSEGWQSILAAMPTVVDGLSKATGRSTNEIRKLGIEGKLSLTALNESLRRTVDENGKLADSMDTAVRDAMTTLRNNFGVFVGKVNETSQATGGLVSSIETLAEALRDPETIRAAQDLSAGVVTAFSAIASGVRETVGVVKWAADELAATLNGVGGHDIVRLEDTLAELQSMRESGPLGRLRFFGRDGIASYATDSEIDAEIAKVKAAISAYHEFGGAAEVAGQAAADSAPKVQQLNTGLVDAASSAGESAKAGRQAEAAAKQQANAYQALYDRLYPAEAAQREYNKQVDLLKKYLSGDQLAKAIDRLNFAMEGADATGPADAIAEYRKELEALEDKINPAGKAAKDFAAEQKRLREEIERTGDPTGKWTALLNENERQMRENTKTTSEWAQWTEGALDRVDSAFADAWRNIGDGFSSFRDSLTNAFKQMLAELAHMAITRPIVMQIGAAMGIGGGTQGNNGIWGSLLGGGSASGGGGMGGALQAANQARSIYSMYGTAQTLLPVLQGGYASGGIGGTLTGVGSYVGSLFGGAGTAASMAAGSTAAGYTGSAYASWAAAQGAGSAAGAGASAGVGGALSSVGGMLSNPVTWIVAGMVASNKLYGQGVRADGSKTAEYAKDSSGLGKAAWAPFTVGSYAVEKMDKLLGSVFGSKFTAIVTGSPVFQAITDFIGGGIFGGKWQTKDIGIGLGVAGGDFRAQQFEDQKKKGGWFKSDKKRTIWSDLDPETAAALQETYDATEAGVSAIFDALSLSVEEGSLDGLQLARKKISTKGKTEEQIQEAIAEWFGSAADAMTAELNKVFATGLDLDLEGMQAFVGNLQGVNEVLRYLDVGMYDASVAGGKLAEALSAAAGGLESLAANSATYYAAFFSEAEKVEDTVDSIKRAFESADVELAASREAYRAMVEDIDLTTEAGQQMFATMMALSGQAAQYFSIVEQQAAQAAAEVAAANALLFGSVSTAYASLQRSIAAQQREIQQAATSTAANINALTGVSNSLDAALKKLRGSSDDTVRMLRAQATMTLQGALVTARAGGSLADYAGLQDALDVASEMDTALYGSLEQFEREQGRTANLIAELEKVNGKQLTTEQKMLSSFEKQLAGLDAQLAFAQSQLDALNGIDNGVLGVAAAIAAMNASVVAALQALPKGAAKSNTPANNRSIVDSIYQSVLGRGTQGDESGAAFWANALQSGTATYQDIATSIAKGALANAGESSAGKKSAEEYLKSLGIPGFASGGLFGGGARIVGERGPELEVTGPSRIYSAGQTAAMLGGAGSTEELRALRGEVAGLRDALHSIAKHTEKTAHGVEQIKDIGIPQEEAA